MAVKKGQRRTRAPIKKSAKYIFGNKKRQEKTNGETTKNNKALIIAQEIKFARLLSNNDGRVRDKVLKNLRNWLTVRSKSSFVFTEADFTRLWKGLFYCMWLSDKPLIQEELAESLSKIVHCFDIKDLVLLYTMCALRTLGTEWFGIDQYRLNKFCMLVRRMIRQTFIKCKERSWDIEWVKGFTGIIEELFVDPKICRGFNMHLTEVFLEELSKISGGDIPEDVVTELVQPFVSYFIIMDDEREIRHVMRHIFRCLIFQSNVGMDYMEKFQAWRVAGFPSGSIDAVEKIEMSDEESEYSDVDKTKTNHKSNTKQEILDPRAGRVDVELPQIPFNAKKIVTLLTQYKYHPSSTTKSRRQLHRLIKEFVQLSEGRMPLGVKEINIPNIRKKDTDTKLGVKRFLTFEKELYSDVNSKKRKRRKNKQVREDKKDTFSGEESEDNNNENSIAKTDTAGNKKKKKKCRTAATYSEAHINSQISDKYTFVSQEKKYDKKGKNIISYEVDIENNNCKVRKHPFQVVPSVNAYEKTKMKKNKTAVANITPVKKKIKVEVCNQWDVSDNTTLSTPTTLIDNGIESCSKMIKKSILSDDLQKKNTPKQLSAWMLPVLKKMETEKNEIGHKVPEQSKVNSVSNTKKRVKIVLQRNTAQHTSEYILQVQRSPSIPYDASRKPLIGVLKASPIASPINPFYKKRC